MIYPQLYQPGIGHYCIKKQLIEDYIHVFSFGISIKTYREHLGLESNLGNVLED